MIPLVKLASYEILNAANFVSIAISWTTSGTGVLLQFQNLFCQILLTFRICHLALNVEIEKLRLGKGGPGKVRG
jgi:hypothetical protein